MFNGSGHFTVVAKVRMRGRWEFKGNGSKALKRRELAIERLHVSGYELACRRKVEE